MKTYEQLSNAIMNDRKSDESGTNGEGGGKCGGVKTSLCRFFFQNNGYCRNGEACRFSHDANGLTHQEAMKTIPCPFYAKGSCRYGEHCNFLHEDVKKSDDELCGICLENVVASNRKFGVLSCCNHTFCFNCLMEWRTEGSSEVTSRRVCPTCRKSSDYVVPSPYMPTNEQEKGQILSNYKAHCSVIPCKNFEIGKLGSCPFGKDCFYAHLSRKGKHIKGRDKSMQQLYEARQRTRNNHRDRDLEYITEMLFMMGLQRHLARRGRDGGGDEDNSDDDSPDIFLSEIISSLLEGDDDPFGGLMY